MTTTDPLDGLLVLNCIAACSHPRQTVKFPLSIRAETGLKGKCLLTLSMEFHDGRRNSLCCAIVRLQSKITFTPGLIRILQTARFEWKEKGNSVGLIKNPIKKSCLLFAQLVTFSNRAPREWEGEKLSFRLKSDRRGKLTFPPPTKFSRSELVVRVLSELTVRDFLFNSPFSVAS